MRAIFQDLSKHFRVDLTKSIRAKARKKSFKPRGEREGKRDKAGIFFVVDSTWTRTSRAKIEAELARTSS